jgi:hypothetical protein
VTHFPLPPFVDTFHSYNPPFPTNVTPVLRDPFELSITMSDV